MLINSFSFFYLLVAILMGVMEAILARVVEGHPRTFLGNYFAIKQLAYEEMYLKIFLF